MLLKFFLVFLYIAIFVSGINQDTVGISIIVGLVASCLGLIHLLKNSAKVKIPQHFGLMVVFVLILHLYLFFINDKTNPFYYATIIGEGLLYWLIFFNIESGSKLLKSLLINVSITYSLFYIISIIFKINLIALAEPFFNGGVNVRHWNIGDLWAFTLIAVIALDWGHFKGSSWLTIGLGFIFLAISNVRSAMLSLAIGLVYFLTKRISSSKRGKIILITLTCFSIALFIISSMDKTTLFDRPYFIQSIQSLAKHPLGVGMGNFKQIGEEYHLNGTDGSQLATTTFNIFFEALSGVGVFSVIFLIFLVNIIRDILKEKGINTIWGAVAITILANFMTDASYNIPSIMWILFITLGVFQSKQKLLIDS